MAYRRLWKDKDKPDTITKSNKIRSWLYSSLPIYAFKRRKKLSLKERYESAQESLPLSLVIVVAPDRTDRDKAKKDSKIIKALLNMELIVFLYLIYKYPIIMSTYYISFRLAPIAIVMAFQIAIILDVFNLIPWIMNSFKIWIWMWFMIIPAIAIAVFIFRTFYQYFVI
jgi:hypothetical protein